MQCRASAVDKMKIEPAMISFMEKTHHPRCWTKMMILSPKKAANLSLISESSKWELMKDKIQDLFFFW